MMGNTIEFYAAKHNLDPAAQPDWLIGEDVISQRPATRPGLPQHGRPEAVRRPEPLLAEVHRHRGQRRRAHQQRHRQPRLLPGRQRRPERLLHREPVPRRAADRRRLQGQRAGARASTRPTQVFYDGFTSLPEYANFCDARNATVAAAGERPASRPPRVGGWPGTPSASTTAARRAPRPRRRAPARRTPRSRSQSPHPYGNNGDCTWTYDNGSAGFAFHFSLMDTEKDYDYVYVKDAAGNMLATYTGNKTAPAFYGRLHPDLDRARCS